MSGEITISVAPLLTVMTVLTGTIGLLFRLLMKQLSERLRDKDKQITQLVEEAKQPRDKNE